ncbi:hypothetical protein OUZ56_027700 [Daphnia magna]|uniref:Uncharacterized protein n=1 Tax=Daphnia magna TaxID=35525 RepID=A0ABR0B1W1_9CRUS|nr:hypothetical protein OUZ56_027700 [Daphnia magna]
MELAQLMKGNRENSCANYIRPRHHIQSIHRYIQGGRRADVIVPLHYRPYDCKTWSVFFVIPAVGLNSPLVCDKRLHKSAYQCPSIIAMCRVKGGREC